MPSIRGCQPPNDLRRERSPFPKISQILARFFPPIAIHLRSPHLIPHATTIPPTTTGLVPVEPSLTRYPCQLKTTRPTTAMTVLQSHLSTSPSNPALKALNILARHPTTQTPQPPHLKPLMKNQIDDTRWTPPEILAPRHPVFFAPFTPFCSPSPATHRKARPMPSRYNVNLDTGDSR
jgi:hypothetical protein